MNINNYDKLTPAQKVIVDKWEEERLLRQELIDQLKDGKLTLEQLVAKMEELTPDHCEHGRHVIKHCIECENIERIIRPELFPEEE